MAVVVTGSRLAFTKRSLYEFGKALVCAAAWLALLMFGFGYGAEHIESSGVSLHLGTCGARATMTGEDGPLVMVMNEQAGRLSFSLSRSALSESELVIDRQDGGSPVSLSLELADGRTLGAESFVANAWHRLESRPDGWEETLYFKVSEAFLNELISQNSAVALSAQGPGGRYRSSLPAAFLGAFKPFLSECIQTGAARDARVPA